MDRTNYSRWLHVYIANLHLLEDTAPEVPQEFMQGNHAVSRSSQPFNQIWTEMALEQTTNLNSKTKCGIVATGAVMPQDITTRLLNAEKLGMQKMNSFLTKQNYQ